MAWAPEVHGGKPAVAGSRSIGIIITRARTDCPLPDNCPASSTDQTELTWDADALAQPTGIEDGVRCTQLMAPVTAAAAVLPPARRQHHVPQYVR
jgi:hypothetical protein